MSFPKSLTVCIAALMMPFRSSPKPAGAAQRLRRYKSTPPLITAGISVAVIALFSYNHSDAQETASVPDSSSVASVTLPAPVQDVNPIMGFENPALWSVRVKAGNPYSNVKSTNVRTQGSAALEVINPPSEIVVTSSPVASNVTALAGVGNSGAILQLDVRVQPDGLPPLASEEQSPNTTNADFIEGFVSVKSLGLNNVPLGQVQFQKFRPGIYNTIGFSIPESLASALKDATFTDMVFEFAITAPENVDGAYMFDNLRVHSVTLVQS